MQNLPRLAKSKYERDGLTSLLGSVPEFVLGEYVVNPHLQRHALEDRELLEFAETRGRTWQFESGGSFTLERPETASDLPQPFEEKERAFDEDPSHVCELTDARLVGGDGLAFAADDSPLLNATRSDRFKLKQRVTSADPATKLRFLSPSRSSSEKHFQSAFPLVGDPTNYYAWVLEFLPKLRGLERYTEATGDEPPILIPEDPPSFMTESIEFLGFGSHDLVECDFESAHVDRLVLTVPHRRHNVKGRYRPHPTGYQWLRDRIEERADPSSSLEKVYFSRHDMETRRALNEDEVVDVLEDRGFTTLKPSELSFEKQVNYCIGTDVFVGVHGSAFTNIMWTDDPLVIEALPPNKFGNSGVYCMCSILGFDYDCVRSEGDEGGVHVDLDRFCAAIDRHTD